MAFEWQSTMKQHILCDIAIGLCQLRHANIIKGSLQVTNSLELEVLPPLLQSKKKVKVAYVFCEKCIKFTCTHGGLHSKCSRTSARIWYNSVLLVRRGGIACLQARRA